MSNGEPTDKVLDRIEAHLLRLEEKVDKKLDAVHSRITEIKVDGCSKRPEDLRRVEGLESWRDKGIIGIVGAFVTALFALFAFIGTLIFKKISP